MEKTSLTIHLPEDLERRVKATVQKGRFASLYDAMAAATRLLLRELEQEQTLANSPVEEGDSAPDPILGLMRDEPELMDEIVADAYRRRREGKWREIEL